ncbi:hypothetical protein CYY_008919 [Polysphondylium violaceum]|uniref:BZIP domain-containing protein n=1 Tax=Polysphondylium violaceum TaxID=133409 RepID=A0A8J4V0W8_9MYCE|nr:hypothetical protein CYY_008919 [Polysphondylium violaceum]
MNCNNTNNVDNSSLYHQEGCIDNLCNLDNKEDPHSSSSPSLPSASPFSSPTNPLLSQQQQQQQHHHYSNSSPLNTPPIGSTTPSSTSSTTTMIPPLNNNNNSTTTTTTTKKLPKAKKEKEQPMMMPTPSSDFNDYDDDDENPNDKQKARRTNQNIASRNYRQRKKVYIKEMEDKISQLTLENDTLKKDLHKVGNNPMEILRFSREMVLLTTEIRKLVVQIDRALRNNESDAAIKSLLNLWHNTMDLASSANEKEIERFVHPFTQAKLAIMGYKPHSNPWTDFVKSPKQTDWWKKFAEKVGLTNEQVDYVTQLWSRFTDDEKVMKKELDELDIYVKNFFLTKVVVLPDNNKLLDVISSGMPVPESLEHEILQTSEMLEFIYNLEKLKQNFLKMNRCVWHTGRQMSKYLTVRQEAMLLVLVHSNTKYIHTNMEMATNLWNQLNQVSPITKPLLVGGLNNPYNTKDIKDDPLTPALVQHHQQLQLSHTQQTTPLPTFPIKPLNKAVSNNDPDLFFGTIPVSQVPLSYQQNSNMSSLTENLRNFQQQQQQLQQQQQQQLQQHLLQQQQIQQQQAQQHMQHIQQQQPIQTNNPNTSTNNNTQSNNYFTNSNPIQSPNNNNNITNLTTATTTNNTTTTTTNATTSTSTSHHNNTTSNTTTPTSVPDLSNSYDFMFSSTFNSNLNYTDLTTGEGDRNIFNNHNGVVGTPIMNNNSNQNNSNGSINNIISNSPTLPSSSSQSSQNNENSYQFHYYQPIQ